jgi:hypothetical protein
MAEASSTPRSLEFGHTNERVPRPVHGITFIGEEVMSDGEK